MAPGKKEATIETVLSHLPRHETQQRIFGRLDIETLLNARSVNKQWQGLIDPMLDFHLPLTDKSLETVKNFGSSRRIKSLSAMGFQEKYPPEGLGFLKVDSLRIIVQSLGDPGFIFEGQTSRQLRETSVGISEYNCRRLLMDFCLVQKLHIASVAVKSIKNLKTLSRLHMPCVKDLVITFFDEGINQLLPFTLNFFPKLKRVSIANVAVSRKDRTSVYSWIFGFVARHHQVLEDVTLIFPEGIVDEEGSTHLGGGRNRNRYRQLPNAAQLLLIDHKMPKDAYEKAKERLEKMQLKSFIWDISMMEGAFGRFDMGTSLLLGQNQVAQLHLDNFRPKDLPLWGKVGKLLQRLTETLTSLSIGGCFCTPITLGEQHKFECSWIKNCNKLKNLEVTICGVTIMSLEDIPKSITTLNLGHMLRQDQIEYIALNMINLVSLDLPQKGCRVSLIIPKVSVYLFHLVLHLPKLTSVTILEECSDFAAIMQFVEREEGIEMCHFASSLEAVHNGDLTFHICRPTFKREHGELQTFMNTNRPDPIMVLEEEVLEHFVRNLLRNRQLYL